MVTIGVGASALTLPSCKLLPSSVAFLRSSSSSSLPGSSSKAPARKIDALRCNASKVCLPISASLKDVDVSKVIPQADRVLILLEEQPETSLGGVLLPKSAVKFEKCLAGKVLSAGKDAGAIEKGQKVLFSDLNAYEVNLGSTEKLFFCNAGDLLAVVD